MMKIYKIFEVLNKKCAKNEVVSKCDMRVAWIHHLRVKSFYQNKLLRVCFWLNPPG